MHRKFKQLLCRMFGHNLLCDLITSADWYCNICFHTLFISFYFMKTVFATFAQCLDGLHIKV